MAGIYIHVPFCKSKCTYCDFASYPKEINKAETYFACMLREISGRAAQLKHKQFNTIYFGGGTPSFVDAKYIVAIMNKLKKEFDIAPDAEITLEANPGTLTAEKVEMYKKVGINRFSLGLQSASDARLVSLNRIHTAEQFKQSCKLLEGCNLSVDVMIGFAGQKNDEIKSTIDLACECGAKHISLYALKAEEGTPMFTNYLNGELPSDDEVADMYDYALGYLKELGFERYEVSNFAKSGYYSRHNMNYWKRGEYIGFGVAASSFIDERRFTNTEKIDEYVFCILHGKVAEIFSENIEGVERTNEFVMLALRTAQGVVFEEYKNAFGSDFLSDYKEPLALEAAYLDIDDFHVGIKDEYLYLQNQIIINFL